MGTESGRTLLWDRIQEPDNDPGQDSRPLCLLLSRISEVDPLLGRIGEVITIPHTRSTGSTPDKRPLAEPSHPGHQGADRQ